MSTSKLLRDGARWGDPNFAVMVTAAEELDRFEASVDGCCLLAGCQRAETAAELERLRQQVADLVNALQTINKWQPSSKTQPRQKIIDSMQFYAHLSIAKATGGE